MKSLSMQQNEIVYFGYTKSEVNSIIKKVYFSLSGINHCRKNISQKSKLQMLRSMIFPLFDYGTILHCE